MRKSFPSPCEILYNSRMTYITIKTDLAKASEIKDFLQAKEICDEKHPYDYFDSSYQGIHIHAYRNKKEIYTISFSGEEEKVKELASIFSTDFTLKKSEPTETKSHNIMEGWEDFGPQIGSDEVGKGDFFGPLIVVASYVGKEDIPYLEKMKINDSKKMNDDYILEIGPALKKKIKNYIVLISADKLSKLHGNHINIDKALSIAHNHAHRGLMKKYDLPDFLITYVDQFLAEDNYRKYVADDIIKNPLYFRTKGETYYPSVAVSSVIARYTFLVEWKKMEEVFHMEIPKGASRSVDTAFGRLKNLYGNEKVSLYVKRFFSNYTKRM